MLPVWEAALPERLDRERTRANEPGAVGPLRAEQIPDPATVLGAGDGMSGRLQGDEGLSGRIRVGFERRKLCPAAILSLVTEKRLG